MIRPKTTHAISSETAKGSAMQVQPYLDFSGRCQEAIDFYRGAIGAEVTTLMHFKDCPEPNAVSSPANKDKVMHAALKIGDSTVFASDGRCSGTANFHGIALALNAKDEADAKRLFGALAEGGQVNMPLTKTFFSPAFGMLADRFGVGWMVIAPQA
jgi:PhnB protein